MILRAISLSSQMLANTLSYVFKLLFGFLQGLFSGFWSGSRLSSSVPRLTSRYLQRSAAPVLPYKTERNDGDGNCFYLSVAQQMLHTQHPKLQELGIREEQKNSHNKHVHAIAASLRNIQEHNYKDHVSTEKVSDEDKAAMVAANGGRATGHGAWVSNLEISNISHFLESPIIVHSYGIPNTKGKPSDNLYTIATDQCANPTIWLSHHFDHHYESVLRDAQSTAYFEPGKASCKQKHETIKHLLQQTKINTVPMAEKAKRNITI